MPVAEKKYKLTAPVLASLNFAGQGDYKFRVGFTQQESPLVICNAAECPVITADGSTVMSTTNEWAQKFLEEQIIPRGISVDGVNFYGTPAGALAMEETTDPATLDLDTIFPTV
jgi:hypothetical protein